MGSRGQGYELNIFENGLKDGHFGGVRRRLSLLLGNVLQPICGPIVFIRKLSIFSFSAGFSKNQRHLELVSVPGDKVMGSIYSSARIYDHLSPRMQAVLFQAKKV